MTSLPSTGFTPAIRYVLELEGGYSNKTWDPGGETIFGISKRWNPQLWKNGSPTLSSAIAFYRRDIWQRFGLSLITSQAIRAEALEASILCGKVTGAEFLQRGYNLICKDYPLLKVDGRPGPVTRHEVNRLLKLPNRERALYAACNHFQANRLVEVGNREAMPGWFAKRLFPLGEI